MVKFEVRTFNVETKNGLNAFDMWLNETNQTTELLASYSTEEEAIAFYSALNVECRRMGSYWLHKGKCVEINVYDYNGEWVECEGSTCSGDWVCYELPNKIKGV